MTLRIHSFSIGGWYPWFFQNWLVNHVGTSLGLWAGTSAKWAIDGDWHSQHGRSIPHLQAACIEGSLSRKGTQDWYANPWGCSSFSYWYWSMVNTATPWSTHLWRKHPEPDKHPSCIQTTTRRVGHCITSAAFQECLRIPRAPIQKQLFALTKVEGLSWNRCLPDISNNIVRSRSITATTCNKDFWSWWYVYIFITKGC